MLVRVGCTTKIAAGVMLAGLSMTSSCASRESADAPQPDAISIADDDLMQWMSWSPDGEQLAVQVLTGHPVGGAVFLVDGPNLVRLTSTDSDVHSFSWMPGSQQLLVAQSPNVDGGRSSSQLAIIDLDGHELDVIEPDPALRLWYGISVDRTGSRIIAAAGPKGPHDLDFEPALWTVDLHTGEATTLDINLEGTPDSPTFDTNGDVVMTVRTLRLTGGFGDDHLAVVDIDTLEVTRITPKDDNVAKFTLRPCTNSVIYTSVGPFQGGGIQPAYERRVETTADSHRMGELEAGFLAVNPVGTDLSYTTYVPFQEGPDVHIRTYKLDSCAEG